ncbi:glycosyltransferase [Empedobacter falsenii]
MQKKLSIIIPVYNTEEYLERCVNSVINCIQDGDSIEILLINDGSTDNSQKIIDEYSKRYNYIKSISHSNKGQAETRNIGIRLSVGKYIWYIDSDDYIKHFNLNTLIDFLDNNNIDVCYFKYREGIEKPIESISLHLDASKIINGNDFFKSIDFSGHACLYIIKREIVQDVYFDKGRFYEDIAYAIEAFSKAQSFYFLEDEIYEYFVNSNSTIRKTNNTERSFKLCDDLVFACNRIANFLELNKKQLSVEKKKAIYYKWEKLVYYTYGSFTQRRLNRIQLKTVMSRLQFNKFTILQTKAKSMKQKVMIKIYNSKLLKKIFFELNLLKR